MSGKSSLFLVAAAVVAAWLLQPSSQPAAQTRSDLRSIHELAAFATVVVETSAGHGTGWLLEQSDRPYIITNKHVVPIARGVVRVGYYQGSDRRALVGRARPVYVSREIDLAVLVPEDPPPTARTLRIQDEFVIRGQRVVLGGNPGGLQFQTTEGVVTGHLPEGLLQRRCGRGRNCVTVDAASFAGSSGGPALSTGGQVVGMLWNGPIQQIRTPAGTAPDWVENPAFAYLVHARVITEELQRASTRRR